jgi:broad specificity phosphatase PhoE
MPTTLYLLRHAATAANLARPARLQGRYQDPLLAPTGVRQAEATRDLLAGRTIDACYCSPLLRAVQTAEIVTLPHRLAPVPLADLTECDVGRWEGLDWDTIRDRDPAAFEQYMADPATVPYPGGESFADVHARVAPVFERLLAEHAGKNLLVVSHHVVSRTYLAGLLGLPIRQSRNVVLDNCGISLVTFDGGTGTVTTLNATFHLTRLAA